MPNALFNDLFKTRKSTATNEENIRGVNLNELLMRVFAATLWWNRRNCALKNLQERLLHPFT